ncbi:MAG: DUF1722 domain-containing protein [Candidatus Omnitrophica bacterium]|nr:DUF1722 domain-containing protein [Candidatus Omnitrophota bacterium]
MSINFPKPAIFSSRCLGFDRCRWNGEIIRDRFVEKLKPYVSYITTCPESEIGLGVPRDPVRVVSRNNSYMLMQLNTEKDLTEKMNAFVSDYIASMKEVDGFILKDRSPSCGIKDVKVYAGLSHSSPVKKGSGFFGAAVSKKFSGIAIETEARLTNFTIREHFLARIFTRAGFRKLKGKPLVKNLVRFHTENKFLLMAYSQKHLKLMGNIVANSKRKPAKEMFAEYESKLTEALAKTPKFTSVINVLMHALGYFAKKLKSEEKKFFLNTLEEYRREQVPLSVPVNIMRSYIIRFNEGYLSQQTFFEPYPKELTEIKDSGEGRSYK